MYIFNFFYLKNLKIFQVYRDVKVLVTYPAVLNCFTVTGKESEQNYNVFLLGFEYNLLLHVSYPLIKFWLCPWGCFIWMLLYECVKEKKSSFLLWLSLSFVSLEAPN